MRNKVWMSLLVVAVFAAACVPQAQPAAEVVEMPATEFPAPAEEMEETLVEEPGVEEPAPVEEPVPVEEAPAEEMAPEPLVLSIPRDFQINLYQGQDVYGGTTVPLSSIFAEGKPVVVNFYAGQCPLCNTELPAMQAAYNQYSSQVNFVLVDIGPFVGLGTEQDGMNMLANLGIQIPGGSTPDVDVLRDYGVFGTPAVSFFNPDGSLHYQHNGVISEAQIVEQLSGLVQ